MSFARRRSRASRERRYDRPDAAALAEKLGFCVSTSSRHESRRDDSGPPVHEPVELGVVWWDLEVDPDELYQRRTQSRLFLPFSSYARAHGRSCGSRPRGFRWRSSMRAVCTCRRTRPPTVALDKRLQRTGSSRASRTSDRSTGRVIRAGSRQRGVRGFPSPCGAAVGARTTCALRRIQHRSSTDSGMDYPQRNEAKRSSRDRHAYDKPELVASAEPSRLSGILPGDGYEASEFSAPPRA